MRNIFISSNAFPVKTIDAIFDECDKRGITHLELGSGVAYDQEADEKIKNRAQKTTILLHNYFPAPKESFVLNLASPDQEVQTKSRALVTHALELSSAIGAPFYAVHSGFAYHAEAQFLGKQQTHLTHFSLDEAHKNFIEAIQALSRTAKKLGVKLLIENNALPPFNLINGANQSLLVVGIEDSLKTMQELSQSGVGLLLDTGHLTVSAAALGFDRVDYLNKLRHYIHAFQLSDNNGEGDQHLPVAVNSWQINPVKTFSTNTPLTLEVNNHLEEVLESRNFFA